MSAATKAAAKYRPIASPDIVDADVAELNDFMRTGDLTSAIQAIRLMCILRSVVAHSGATDFPAAPADCFCEGNRMKPEHWESSGDELRFIIAATEKALRKVEAKS